MKYILDTNIFIFLLDKEYERLTKTQFNVIDDSSNQLIICEASFFEMAIKIRLEKANFSHITMEDAENFRKKIKVDFLKTTYSHYENIVNIPKILRKDGKPHADPFDLLIIATAQKENIPVLSSDTYFPEYKIIKTST